MLGAVISAPERDVQGHLVRTRLHARAAPPVLAEMEAVVAGEDDDRVVEHRGGHAADDLVDHVIDGRQLPQGASGVCDDSLDVGLGQWRQATHPRRLVADVDLVDHRPAEVGPCVR
jgi:hypothetical protein